MKVYIDAGLNADWIKRGRQHEATLAVTQQFGESAGHPFHGNQYTGDGVAGSMQEGAEYRLTYRPVVGSDRTETVTARYRGIRTAGYGPKAVFVVTGDDHHPENTTVEKELLLGPSQLHELDPLTQEPK